MTPGPSPLKRKLFSFVMAGLVPAIHVDHRDMPGDDGKGNRTNVITNAFAAYSPAAGFPPPASSASSSASRLARAFSTMRQE